MPRAGPPRGHADVGGSRQFRGVRCRGRTAAFGAALRARSCTLSVGGTDIRGSDVADELVAPLDRIFRMEELAMACS